MFFISLGISLKGTEFFERQRKWNGLLLDQRKTSYHVGLGASPGREVSSALSQKDLVPRTVKKFQHGGETRRRQLGLARLFDLLPKCFPLSEQFQPHVSQTT